MISIFFKVYLLSSRIFDFLNLYYLFFMKTLSLKNNSFETFINTFLFYWLPTIILYSCSICWNTLRYSLVALYSNEMREYFLLNNAIQVNSLISLSGAIVTKNYIKKLKLNDICFLNYFCWRSTNSKPLITNLRRHSYYIVTW